MKDNSVLIRDIEQLRLSQIGQEIAKELISKIEFPVVFLMNSNYDKNYACRNPYLHNQFWVTLKRQGEESEEERIILANLYRGLQSRRRYSIAAPREEYIRKIMKNSNNEQIRLYEKLLGKINAFATTLDAEVFLKQYGIVTSEKVRKEQFDNRVELLEEYLDIQKHRPGFFWYKEVAVCNVIDYANFCRLDSRYEKAIKKLVKKIKPTVKALQLIEQIEKIKALIQLFFRERVEANSAECVERLIKQIVEIFSLHEQIIIKTQYAMGDSIKLKTGANIEVRSYVPEGVANEQLLVDSIRNINSGLVCLQEYFNTFDVSNCVDLHVNIAFSEECNAYVYGNRKKGYYVTYLEGLILKIVREAESYNVIANMPVEVMDFLGEDYLKSRLIRYAFYFSIFHEYGHIINGDCDNNEAKFSEYDTINKSRIQKEKRADQFAREMLVKIIPLQYRMKQNAEYGEKEVLIKNIKCDRVIACDAIHLLEKIRDEIKQEE